MAGGSIENKFRLKPDPGWIQADNRNNSSAGGQRRPVGSSMKTLPQAHNVPSYTYTRKLKICDRNFAENGSRRVEPIPRPGGGRGRFMVILRGNQQKAPLHSGLCATLSG